MTTSTPFRYVNQRKTHGVTYTPPLLSDFVATQIVQHFNFTERSALLRILDPAVGHGELLLSLLRKLRAVPSLPIEVHGFDLDSASIETAHDRISREFPQVNTQFQNRDFLEYSLGNSLNSNNGDTDTGHSFDDNYFQVVIANPPYVRTQVLGSAQAQRLVSQFGLSGRVDLYFAFLVGISRVFDRNGIGGIIVSNRFMTTKSGACVREFLLDRFKVQQIWDFGDTKLFDAAVLPAVLLVRGRNEPTPEKIAFTSIYESTRQASREVSNVFQALGEEGISKVKDGRQFNVRRGSLLVGSMRSDAWSLSNHFSKKFLSTVEQNSWKTFGEISKVRVGVKTCADKVFIRSDWENLDESLIPELLKPLTTHRVANRFHPGETREKVHIVYPHYVLNGSRKVVDLSQFPKTKAYFELHRNQLEQRQYLLDAGREWFELWVPQDPSYWEKPKLVFRDISQQPTFWMDLDKTVINGDCYFMVSGHDDHLDLLWLASAVGNSRFLEAYYDVRFNNKLYAGRRRFMAQYVQEFPLPDPRGSLAKNIVKLAKQSFGLLNSRYDTDLQQELDEVIFDALLKDSSIIQQTKQLVA